MSPRRSKWAKRSAALHPRFETGDSRYAWLNDTICVGTGMRRASSVHVNIFAVG